MWELPVQGKVLGLDFQILYLIVLVIGVEVVVVQNDDDVLVPLSYVLCFLAERRTTNKGWYVHSSVCHM